MKPTVLLVNPPIYDFSAYDFWLKPYGLLRVGGLLRNHCDLRLFDYMDRESTELGSLAVKTDQWGCGPYPKKRIQKPKFFENIPRFYNRFGKNREVFEDFCKFSDIFKRNRMPDCVLIQTSMT